MAVLSFPTPSPSEDHIYCRREERTDTDNIEKSDAKQTQTYFKTTKDKALYQPGQPFVEKVLANARNVNHYTGVTNKGLIEALFSSLEFGVPNLRYWNSSRNTTHTGLHTGPSWKLIPFYEFIMTLVRIKLNLSVTLLGHLFDVSPTSVTGITLTWINYLDLALVPVLVYWPTKEQVQANMPSAFRRRYPKTRVVIDATEFAIDKIHNPDGQYATYSQYKSTNTLKVLVGVSPCGSFTFIGDVWSGNSNDKFVTANSKLISLLEPSDEVMADRGFRIEDLLHKKNCHLTAPPFTRRAPNAKNKRLNVPEIRKTAVIANLRIHVERAIQSLKTFRMLRQRMPVSLKVVAGQVVRIAAGLCNLKPQLIRKR